MSRDQWFPEYAPWKTGSEWMSLMVNCIMIHQLASKDFSSLSFAPTTKGSVIWQKHSCQ
jgi:hypothetical protein